MERNDSASDSYDDTYDMVTNDIPLRNIRQNTQNGMADGLHIVSRVENPYYTQDNFERSRIPEGKY